MFDLEMFARFPHPGWDRWGLDADLNEIGPRRWRATSYPDAPQAAD
jgi:N6-adenosine-specific RNA methylase IME4